MCDGALKDVWGVACGNAEWSEVVVEKGKEEKRKKKKERRRRGRTRRRQILP